MLEKVRILMQQKGFQIIGRDISGAEHTQEWSLLRGQNARQLSGNVWREFDLTARWVQALEQIVIASTRLARHYQAGLYGTVECMVAIGAGYVEAYLNQGKENALWLRQEWNEYRQLKPLHVLGDFQAMSDAFLADFREACFGRYGLLARTMEQQLDMPLLHCSQTAPACLSA